MNEGIIKFGLSISKPLHWTYNQNSIDCSFAPNRCWMSIYQLVLGCLIFRVGRLHPVALWSLRFLALDSSHGVCHKRPHNCHLYCTILMLDYCSCLAGGFLVGEQGFQSWFVINCVVAIWWILFGKSVRDDELVYLFVESSQRLKVCLVWHFFLLWKR